jgi:hypothetical protein
MKGVVLSASCSSPRRDRTFGDEFREDVGLVGIQEKFRKALA